MSTVQDYQPATATGLSLESVRVLLSLIDSIQVSMASPNVEQQFTALIRARRELQTLLEPES